MALPIDELDKAVTTQINDETTKFNAITKEQIMAFLDLSNQNLSSVDTFFKQLEPKLGEILAKLKTNPGTTAGSVYQMFTKQLSGTAARLEAANPFGAMRNGIENYMSILEQLSAGMNEFVPGKTLTLYSAKISHVTVLGLAKEASEYSRFVISFVNSIVGALIPDTDKLAPYIVNYLKAGVEGFATSTNQVVNFNMSKTTVNQIKNLVKSGTDTLLVGPENLSNVKLVRNTNESTISQNLLASGASGLGIFRWLGNRKADKLDRKIRKMETERKLLQAQVDLMQLKLSNIDENSPEYQNLVKIINNYNGMLAKMEREINEYYGE